MINSTKFLLATGMFLVSSFGFLTSLMDGGTYVASMTVILGIYGAVNVAQKKVMK
jgi:hypothetical protein